MALAPDHHDALVAVVSHVPHLTAASLMRLADDRATEHRALLRLAAGGFRDMTRIASGHPGIWPDICAENRTAIVDVLDGLLASLTEVRGIVADDDRDGLLTVLEQARAARANLPSRLTGVGDLCEVRIPVPDRAGRARRGHHAGRHARREHRRPRDRPLQRGRPGRAHPPRRGPARPSGSAAASSTRATGPSVTPLE